MERQAETESRKQKKTERKTANVREKGSKTGRQGIGI